MSAQPLLAFDHPVMLAGLKRSSREHAPRYGLTGLAAAAQR